jgi:hypothetical protein
MRLLLPSKVWQRAQLFSSPTGMAGIPETGLLDAAALDHQRQQLFARKLQHMSESLFVQ